MPKTISLVISDAWTAAAAFYRQTPEEQIANLEISTINNANHIEFERSVFDGLTKIQAADPAKAKTIKDKLIADVAAEVVKIP